MKKILFSLAILTILTGLSTAIAKAQEDVVTIEVPASELSKIDVNYTQKAPTKTEKAIDATKSATKKTVEATKETTSKAVTATKKATKKTVEATKSFTNKTVEGTKDVTKKSVEATKNFTNKTVEGTKDAIDNLNPNKPVTLEGLETKAEIKTLKSERNELKSAYNSRIKDINAKIKATEKSTTLSDVQRQSKIYSLNKEKADLVDKRDKMVERYNDEIELIKIKSKKES